MSTSTDFAGNWTYSGDPTDSMKDQVRFLVGDTKESEKLASDEEIGWAIDVQPKTYLAAALVARGIAAKFARMADKKSVGDLSLSYFKRKEAFELLAKRLEDEANDPFGITSTGFAAYAGGISVADKDLNDADTDRTPPNFYLGMHDNEESDTSGV